MADRFGKFKVRFPIEESVSSGVKCLGWASLCLPKFVAGPGQKCFLVVCVCITPITTQDASSHLSLIHETNLVFVFGLDIWLTEEERLCCLLPHEKWILLLKGEARSLHQGLGWTP